ncbi:MAG: hypothetical protein HZB26_17985 [Candidatus Hydrogenedentes bacterium]|nr:hypothetical protein [Candidatus Hydrogenedentota bacterium]
MVVNREVLESRLNDFNPAARRAALEELAGQARRGQIDFTLTRPVVNLHCHTFFSYNGYGYSPSYIAWRARCEGLYMAGIVDFDVLDAVDEFLAACELLDLKGCAGIETRIFVPEFHTRVINSPGEPGISYHMGCGFTSSKVDDTAFLNSMKDAARRRNEEVVARVNGFLCPVQLDYERDVLPLVPKGNATERHLCMAYDAKASEVIPDAAKRAAFWAEKLGENAASIEKMFADPPVFQGVIRAKTMKAGGVGYVKPEGAAFPRLDAVNALTLSAGAIPTHAWLDGTTEGERDIEELLDLEMAAGVAAVNIIPDRNWNIKDPAARKIKVAHFHKFVELAKARDLPIIVGTEMNAYGNRFVDDFDAPEMQSVASAFIEGANILFTHTVLQSAAGLGYLSPWAKKHFASTKDKNKFFAELGAVLTQWNKADLGDIGSDPKPAAIAALLG